MEERETRELLRRVASGEVAPDEAIQKCHPGGSRTDYAFAKAHPHHTQP